MIHLQPRLKKNQKEARELSKAIRLASNKYNLDWKLITAILFRESGLKKDPQNCYSKPEKCSLDLGVGQIRKAVWDRNPNMVFDRKLLLTNYSYNVEAVAKILNYYRTKYSHKDVVWFGRFHSATLKYKTAYLKALSKHLLDIEFFLDGSFEGKTFKSIVAEK